MQLFLEIHSTPQKNAPKKERFRDKLTRKWQVIDSGASYRSIKKGNNHMCPRLRSTLGNMVMVSMMMMMMTMMLSKYLKYSLLDVCFGGLKRAVSRHHATRGHNGETEIKKP